MSVLRDQGWNAQPEHGGGRPRDLDGAIQVVHAGGEDEVLAATQSLVDRGRRIGWPCDKEVVDRDGGSGGLAGAPRRARRVVLNRRYEDFEVALGVGVEEGRLAGYRARGQRRERAAAARLLARETLCGRSHDAGEH